ncbi:MAG: saccharopine dehydrogenase [Candidatus Marinimicrobia bacterium]|mgnify:CR=1 FL=1|jgi:saccharopine dehydrogenase (NADP+, L-glutamate forming)/spermidine synthase|nr:saccharopine dehydrogenase [Candidatus Neomarinimicrobiota bacterium]MBT3633185.1 saccharopine dehydrogenase [Candidatus Neomarinimicrobiota bacterium]MBT3682214.1 saccharopine dehydrogenase [Candidatus Neomarinimicrobiota bacterium]MBT3758785.1 saccharopine dehydrogenase [Candidatus Neomarinimicrobiota bacterium]MBT3895341.1 saccharopine dehydrogenase [Candidatus Neomarinimicrobiota bacterium]
MKKKILVFGAGLVSRPGIHYLLKKNHLSVTVADIDLDKAKSLLVGYDHAKAIRLDINDTPSVRIAISNHDIIVSLLPWEFHPRIAKTCILESRHLITASYVSDEMRDLDKEAREKDILLLNEMGVDPGYDHMTAMDVIDRVKNEGGKVTAFYSYCGGLPSPENNDNPLGYKFSWSPKGALLSSVNSAQYKENGKIIKIDGPDLMSNTRIEEITGMGDFEVYPNRDSLPYMSTYGLNDASTIMRGTLRYKGWSETHRAIQNIGMTNETKFSNLQNNTYREIMAQLSGAKPDSDLKKSVAEKIGVNTASPIINQFEWLGLFSNKKVTNKDNHLDILVDLMEEKMSYSDNEKDMIILQHTFHVESADGTPEKIVSTLIDYGIPFGDSSMARTVSLPLAVSVGLMADNKIKCRGVQIPIIKEIYKPVLKELETLGIKMTEKFYSI